MLSNLPPDWPGEHLDHLPNCPALCDLPLLFVASTGEYECDDGHSGHECECDDLAVEQVGAWTDIDGYPV